MKYMKNILDSNIDCTGCRLCEQICSKKCITFASDSEGFLVPQIDKDNCIDCGLCVKVCPQLKDVSLKVPIETYAACASDELDLSKSTSGGAFYFMAKQMIANGGMVFGCIFNEELRAQHHHASTLDEVKKMRGSKYVQSDTLNTFDEVLTLLKKENPILYTGTPCQIAGLRRYLEAKHADNSMLITVDIVCHGVPSPGLFNKYKEWYEKKNKCHIIAYDFRCKDNVGWNNGYFAKVVTDRGTKIFSSHKDPYFYAFLKGKTYRECCYNCKYSKTNRVADITIADYWGIDKIHPEFFNKNGVSLVLVNTTKGYEYFKNTEGLDVFVSDLNKAKVYNRNLNTPVVRPQERGTIYNGLYELSALEFFKRNFKIELSKREGLALSLPIPVLMFIRRIKKYFK